MLRQFVALAALGLAGAVMLPDPSLAGGGMRAYPHAYPAGGFRGPLIVNRTPRALLRAAHRPHAHGARAFGSVGFGHRGFGLHGVGPRTHTVGHEFGRRTPAHSRAHLARRHLRIDHSGSIFPVTIGDEVGFIGTPYDPSEAILVYAPQPDTEIFAVPLAPRLSGAREENRDGCRSERVTVPASEGEREILIVRC